MPSVKLTGRIAWKHKRLPSTGASYKYINNNYIVFLQVVPRRRRAEERPAVVASTQRSGSTTLASCSQDLWTEAFPFLGSKQKPAISYFRSILHKLHIEPGGKLIERLVAEGPIGSSAFMIFISGQRCN